MTKLDELKAAEAAAWKKLEEARKVVEPIQAEWCKAFVAARQAEQREQIRQEILAEQKKEGAGQ